MRQQDLSKLAFYAATAFGEVALAGLHLLEDTLDLAHVTEASFRVVLNNANTENNRYQESKTDLRLAHENLREASKKALWFAQVTRDVLKPTLGSRYSVIWDEVGFIHRTLELPRNIPKTLGLVKSMELFLKSHPDLAVPGLVTGELAEGVYSALASAFSALHQAKKEQRRKKAARDVAAKKLRVELQMLRRELSMLLPADDPNWLKFGFNVPADVSVPPAPENVTVTLEESGHAKASWGDSVTADRYRVYQRVTGTGAEYVSLATTTQTEIHFGILAPGTKLELRVTAINAAGESVPSETVKLQVPVPEEPGAKESEAGTAVP
jgi:hypothetical protein